jgi:hypothetical protein
MEHDLSPSLPLIKIFVGSREEMQRKEEEGRREIETRRRN